MAIKTKNGYACGYCHKEFTGNIAASLADECKANHNLIFLQLSKEDLQRLLMFIYSKDERVLGETIVDRLQSAMKGSFITDLFEIPKEKEKGYESPSSL